MPRKKKPEADWRPQYSRNRGTPREVGEAVYIADLPPAGRIGLTKIGKGPKRRLRKAVVLGRGVKFFRTYRVRVEGAGELVLDAGLLETMEKKTNENEKEKRQAGKASGAKKEDQEGSN